MGNSPRAADATQPSPAEIEIREDQELIDRILYLRSLATDGPEVEKMMEPLLVTTGHWQRGTPLSLRDHADLDEVEAKLRHYLLNDDPAHAYTTQTLAHELIERHKARTGVMPSDSKRLNSTLLVVAILGFIGIVVAAYLLFRR